MNVWFSCAAVLSVVITLVHVFAGGRTVANPLLQAHDIAPMPKYVNYYCWHNVTFSLALMSGLFALAAFGVSTFAFAMIATLSAGFFCVWGLLLPWLKGQPYANVPQGFFFIPVASLGAVGLWFS